jgi:hypothetical protein
MVSRAGLDVVNERKSLVPDRNQFLARSLVVCALYFADSSVLHK